MKRCTKCILPENYLGIFFNEDGICNFCLSHKPRNYLGGEALREAIKSFQPIGMGTNSTYDCVVGLSGGRDSSYLLFYLVNVLNLKVLAYCVDNGFMPEQTRLNIERMVNILDVKLVLEEHSHLKDCLEHHIQAWMHRPSAAMVGMLCTGCRFDIDTGLINFAQKNNIPVIVSGSTPLEGGSYKRDIIKLNPGSKKASSFVFGYLHQVLQNPRWVISPVCFKTQIQEYMVHFRKKRKRQDLLFIGPFFSYIHWVENEVISTIENELGWEKHSNTGSTWRGDCDVALLKLYLYKKILGYNDKDDGLSCLIRDKQLSREEALIRVEDEGDIPDEVISEILDKLGLDFSSIKDNILSDID